MMRQLVGTVSNLGYPRIGENREWKKELEAYWAGKSDRTRFTDKMQSIRLANLRKQHAAGVDLIPVGDFSVYDQMLDHSVAFGLVPERFRPLTGDDALDLSFAMARGAEGIPACEMTKWFNTNYHYIVPEWPAHAAPALVRNPWLEAYVEARRELGLLTKPVIVGPYTFAALSKGIPQGGFPGAVRSLLPVYRELLVSLRDAGAQWVQLDEPALAGDVDASHWPLVQEAYDALAGAAPELRLLLQTYFDAPDRPELLFRLPVAGIGLDFVHGRERNLAALAGYGFPADKTLGAGLVDGRNIWRTDLAEALATLADIRRTVPAERLLLQPSCSLLHVPVTLRHETSLPEEAAAVMAFADEKLAELELLGRAVREGAGAIAEELAACGKALDALRRSPARNRFAAGGGRGVESGAGPGSGGGPGSGAFAESGTGSASGGASGSGGGMMIDAYSASGERSASGGGPGSGADSESGAAYRRAPFERRLAVQQEYWKLPLLPTTTIGSLPQTADVRRARLQWRKGELTDDAYEAFIRGRIREWIAIQEELGLDVLVHGEFERNDMVEFFGEKLEGYLFTTNGWVQSYGSRCVKPPILYGDIVHTGPITVAETAYAASLTEKPVKGMLTGPLTMLNWSFARTDLPRKAIAFQLADAIRAEVEALEAAGIGMIQVDEPALREGAPLKKREWDGYLAWAVEAFRRTVATVKDETQIHTHMCYCDYHDMLDAIRDMDADVISLETSRSHGILFDTLRERPYDKGIGLGVYDIHSPFIPETDEMEAIIAASLETAPARLLWINPDCGLKTRNEEETKRSLRRMTEAARRQREKLARSSGTASPG